VRSREGVVAAAVPGMGAAAVSAVALGLLLARANGRGTASLVEENLATNAVLGVGFAVAAVLVLRARAGHLLGWVFLAEAILNSLTVLAWEWTTYTLVTDPGALPLGGLAAWVASFAWWPALLLLAAAVPLLYPDGRLPSRRWRPVGWLAGGALVLAASAAAMSEDLLADIVPGRANPLAPDGLSPALMVQLAIAGMLLCACCGLAGLASIAVRMRRASGDERGRLAWFLAALLPLVVVYAAQASAWIVVSAVAFLPIALGVAVVRHGLYNGDQLLNRALVYTILTVLIVAVFATAVGLLGNSLGGTGAGAVVAAVAVALGLNPTRSLVQRGVDRLLYGHIRDPYAALTGLGRRLSDALSPADVLPIVVQTLATSLRLPYAGVHLGNDDLPAAAHGCPSTATAVMPLQHAGQRVGSLILGMRPGQHELDHEDASLLQNFLPHVAVAVHTTRLSDDLRRSRDRIARASDEERHRIRRDLHDGLGPTLAGLALGLGAARRSASARDPETARLLTQLQQEMRQCLRDVRDLVAHMRSTPLDQVGLLEALRQHAQALTERTGGALTITVSARGPLPTTTADTDLAAYRIAMEAMTNVARHASAHRCRVDISADADSIRLVIEDDGVGLDTARHYGLGLRSMVERARELGGTCGIGPGTGRGTTVTATLPVRRSA
jgi:two-component system, NarL family, sensor kinase